MVAILLLVGIAIVYFFMTPLISSVSSFIRGGADASVCTLSLFGGKGIARCPIDDVIISEEIVEIKYGARDESEEEGYETLMEIENFDNPQEMVNEAFAKLLLGCLNRGGGLNSRSFSRNNWFASQVVCLECSGINLEDGADVSGLAFHMNDKKPKGAISDKKYIQLLTRDDQQLRAYNEFGTQRGLWPQNTATLTSGIEYTLFFIGFKKGGFGETLSNFWSAITLDIKGIFENSDTYFAYITESRKLGEVCPKKVN